MVRHAVGLRPVREGGTRVEAERTREGWCVHSYGHGGGGYQGSYGCAMEVEGIVRGILMEDGEVR